MGARDAGTDPRLAAVEWATVTRQPRRRSRRQRPNHDWVRRQLRPLRVRARSQVLLPARQLRRRLRALPPHQPHLIRHRPLGVPRPTFRPTKRSATTGTPSSPSRRADLATIPKAPHRTFPPSPPAPLPSLVHGEITFIQGNSSTTTSIPLGTVVHLRVDSRRYDTPNSTDPLVLTPPSPPGVLADFRAVGLAGAVTGQGVRVDGDALGRVYVVLRRGCGLRDAVPGVLDEVGGLVGGCC